MKTYDKIVYGYTNYYLKIIAIDFNYGEKHVTIR